MIIRGNSSKTRWWIALLAVFALFVAACGDDGDDGDGADDPDTGTETPADGDGEGDPPDDADPPADDDTDPPADDGADDDAADGPSITIEPSSGLSDGDVITVSGAGFTPGLTLGINQCSDQGDSTGAGDCDLAAIATVEVGADGTVPPTEFTVNAGPFGENQRVCDPDNPCVISLGELTADADAERATQQIEFA